MKKKYVCLFCCSPELNYEPKTEFTCSDCVQMFSNADPKDLRRAYRAAINRKYLNEDHRSACEQEYLRKAKAIKSFLIEGENYERKTKKPKRNMVRTRSMRAARPARVQGR